MDIPTYLNWQFSENALIWLPLGSRMCPIWVSQVAHLLTSDLAEVGLNRVQIRQLQKLAGSSGVAWSSYGCHRLRTYSTYPSINLSFFLSLSFSYLSYLSYLSFLFLKCYLSDLFNTMFIIFLILLIFLIFLICLFVFSFFLSFFLSFLSFFNIFFLYFSYLSDLSYLSCLS